MTTRELVTNVLTIITVWQIVSFNEVWTAGPLD